MTEYLLDKLTQRGRPSDGVVILRLYDGVEEDMINLVNIAFHTIQTHFTRHTSSSPTGTAGLTQLSTAIGQQLNKRIKREPLLWNMQVKLGDLFVEAFYNLQYIDIYEIYMNPDDDEDQKVQYIVQATINWLKLADLPDMLKRIKLTGTRNHPYTSMIIKENDTDYSSYDLPWTRAINKLHNIGWRVNNRVLDSLIANKHLFVSNIEILDNEAKEMKRRSKNVEWAFIITKANKLRDEDVFYQEIEADYRGRLYYTEAFFNYQGSDIARGMMKFARAKPMTKEGSWWLAVHTANSYNESYGVDEIPDWVEADYKSYLDSEGLESISVDKMTLNDRVRWTNENMESIIELGRASTICMEAEKPVSFLAASIEWYDYQQAIDENRIHFTHLPIGIDGSNNGWQHLGAISKDTRTGELVGLNEVEIQKDFYVQTAKALYDLTDGRLREILDAMPMKDIRKGISKRGSMTRAYSAGADKIGENMWFDCRTEDYHEAYDITEDDCNDFAELLIDAINTVCPGPLETMIYMQDLAGYEIGKFEKVDSDMNPLTPEQQEILAERSELYTKEFKTDEDIYRLNDLTKICNTFTSKLVYGNGNRWLTWTTPSGFPVTYTCYTTVTRKCRGTIYGFKKNQKTGSTVKHVLRVSTKTPDVRGFMCGVSPNFIHSLDASHMALVLDKWSGDFGAVHDSFATHACDVDELLALTKQKFVEIYDVDNFYDYIRKEITNNTDDVEQPILGELDIKEVYDSDYFFA